MGLLPVRPCPLPQATLHIDDHLVCQQGANKGTCGVDGGNHPCAGTDNPLPTLTRTALPVRLAVMYNTSTSTGTRQTSTVGNSSIGSTRQKALARRNVAVHIAAAPSTERPSVHHSPAAPSMARAAPAVAFAPTLPALEVQRRAMQQGLLQGWGMYYDMSYLDHILLPQGMRVNMGLCEIGPEGNCVTEARIDWADKAQLPVDVRLGMHAYDRSFNQLYLHTTGTGNASACNISITGGGGAAPGAQLLLAVEVIAGCKGYALVPSGHTTWFRANTVSANSTAITFRAHGLPNAAVHSTLPSHEKMGGVVVNTTFVDGPHLTYALADGFKVAFNSGENVCLLAVACLAAPALAERVHSQTTHALAEQLIRFGGCCTWSGRELRHDACADRSGTCKGACCRTRHVHTVREVCRDQAGSSIRGDVADRLEPHRGGAVGAGNQARQIPAAAPCAPCAPVLPLSQRKTPYEG